MLSKVPRTDAVSATLNGTTSSVLFTAVAFQRGPANLQVVSGDAQSGVAGSVLPARFEVKATDVLGNPVSGVTVAFAAATGGGSVSPTTATTGTTGTAATTMTLGGLVGPQRFTASAGSLTASVTATATAGMVSHLLYVSGNGQADTACATLKVPLVVQATDAFGNGVSGVTVTWQQVGGPGSANSSPASLTTDSLGYSAVSYRLSSAAGVDTLVAALQVTTAMPITFYETATTSARSSCASPQRAPSTAPALGQRAPGAPSVPSGSSWQPVTGFLPGRGRP
jgi:hypothetical protein